MTRRWILRPRSDPPGGLGLPPLVAHILAARGRTDPEDVRTFCDPRLTQLREPSAIPDLDRAAGRLLDGLRRGESIVIWGDYDVDGVTAAAILHHMCRAIAPEAPVSIFIPHRIDDGYGLNIAGLRELAGRGADLIITVDCGVTAAEPARVARELGVDLIITDHHQPPASLDDLPDAYALVHPGRPDAVDAFPDLSGAGVAYKLAWRLAALANGSDRVDERTRTLLVDLLALAALGTIADVVPLIDENRIIARFGLSRLKSSPFVGVQALIEASGLAGERISSEDVGFRLAPRLNACGRMGHAREAAELLVTSDPVRAARIAQELTKLNEARRAIERDIAEHAATLARESGMTSDDRRAVVLTHPDWHPGVIGIVCSRLVERFGRPVVLMRRENGVCAGSCRSIEGFNVHEALQRCAEHLDTFGGHEMAAGLRLPADRLDDFTDDFTRCANDAIAPEDLVPSLTIDCEASLADMTRPAVEQLRALGPHGRSNPHPVVMVRDVRLINPPRPIGAHGRHLKLDVRQGDVSMRLVGWNWGEHRASLHPGDAIDIAIAPQLNEWRGVVSVEPHIRDIARSG